MNEQEKDRLKILYESAFLEWSDLDRFTKVMKVPGGDS